jgi:hypothetical protein
MMLDGKDRLRQVLFDQLNQERMWKQQLMCLLADKTERH